MVIPVPETQGNITYYDRLYKGDFRQPKQLIHIQRESLVLSVSTENKLVDPKSFNRYFLFLFLSICISTAFGLDSEQPDYDMDSEDETLLNRLNRKMELKPLQFEIMVDRLEKASANQVSQHAVVTSYQTGSQNIFYVS